MAKSANSILGSLNLLGLKKTPAKKSNLKTNVVLSSIPQQFDPLKDLALEGSWEGTGFNLIELPNMNLLKPGPPPADKFKVVLNATSETIIFSEISGEVANRGNSNVDVFLTGLHYLQQVNDITLPKGQAGIHLETGLFMNVPKSNDPNVDVSVARLGSIPHGDSLMAQGRAFEVAGGPQISDVDSTPFTIVNGQRVNDTSTAYLSILNNAKLPPGIPKEAVLNPNLILKNAIIGQNIIKTVVIILDANPLPGVGNVSPSTQVGGITNIPFVNVNANAISLSAIFWIETVQNPDGTTFLQLQYTQTVILDFPVFSGAPNTPTTDIKWPHISVATLKFNPKK
jgi:hypothetical protein